MLVRTIAALAAAVIAVCLAAPAAAQDTPAAPAEPEAAPSGPWDENLAELRAGLRPLRAEAIGEIAERWLRHLQDAVAETSRLSLEGAGSAEALNAATLRKNAVIDRLDAVLDALEAKGGDAAEYRAFVSAVSDVEIDPFDAAAVTVFVRSWLLSPEGGIALALNIVKFLAILVVFWVLSRIAGGAVRAGVGRLPKTSSLLRDFLVGTTKRVVLLIGVVIAISFLGVNITPLVAAIGAAGLVIGLALQGTLSNFASGILILIYRPYDVGDVISGGGVTGKVESMNLVSTRVLTFDNQVMFEPNNEICNGGITNITGLTTRRVDLTFGIGYGDDAAKAQAILEDILGSHPKVLKDPAPVIKLHELADSSVNFVVRPWSLTSDYWDVYWDVTRSVKERFDAEGVGIPFPQRDLHLPEPVRVVVSNG